MRKEVIGYFKDNPDKITLAIQSGYITLDDAIEILTNKTNKMKSFITIEGKEFELPDELVNKIKKELNKPKKLMYEEISRILFEKKLFYIDEKGKISDSVDNSSSYGHINNCTSKKQAEKLLAINKLMNTAKYLNHEWKPDWTDNQQSKVYIYVDSNYNVGIETAATTNRGFVYFKTGKLAQQCIDILGKETIKLALSTDW
jgi:hypothetical protein